MKTFIFCLLALVLASCAPTSSIMTVPANGSLELDYPEYELYEVKLKNKSFTDLEVQVKDKKSQEGMRGFGLGTKSNTEVLVEDKAKLVLSNNSNKRIRVKIGITEKEKESIQRPQNSISFTLANTSAKSIPLLIPNVMNPNLSPFSTSGVDLEIGQEILFREKGKKYVLLTVDESIEEGQKIDVPKLMRERKKELGL